MKGIRNIGFLLFMLGISLNINAQNLIPNPSFDIVDSCNTQTDWIWNLSSWTNLGFYDGVDFGTPDVYNACNSQGPPINSFSVPYTWLTFQYPNSGDGFIGMDRGLYFNRPNEYLINIDQSREYFAAELIDTLQAGNLYCVGGYMNNMNLHFIPPSLSMFWTVRTDRFSVGFHHAMPVMNNTWLNTEINQIANLTNENSSLVYDTLGWEHMRTPYLAQGNESHIVMGNLFSDSASGYSIYTNMNQDSIYALPLDELTLAYYASGTYFYFDDMYVIPIRKPSIEVVDGGNGFVWLVDTTSQEEKSWFKTGDDAVLGTGDSLYLHVSDGASYSLHTRNCRVEMSDTVVIDLTGIKKLNTETEMRVFPNPSEGILTIDFKGESANMQVYSITGQLLFKRLINSGETISMEPLPTGTYIVELIPKSGYSQHRIVEIIR